MTQSLAKLAGMLCTNPKFQAHIGATSSDSAAAILRLHCKISSRRELDINKDAAQKFHQIRKSFAYGATNA